MALDSLIPGQGTGDLQEEMQQELQELHTWLLPCLQVSEQQPREMQELQPSSPLLVQCVLSLCPVTLHTTPGEP